MSLSDLPVTVRLSEEGELVVLDQTKLPGQVEYIALSKTEDVAEAISSLRVRGAPAIGVAAAMGAYAAARHIPERDDFMTAFRNICRTLSESRPTAVNLMHALGRMERAAASCGGMTRNDTLACLRAEAEAMRGEDEGTCRGIGECGAPLLTPGMGVLTHCNAGALATCGIGTATAPVYTARGKGVDVRVYCDETRPLLQGARLTAWELTAAGVDTTLICDDMAASVMARGLVDIVFVGCDRVARNGDTANKIGTLGVAIMAKHFGIPLYVCAPSSTIDPDTADGSGIPIEQRDREEVRSMWYSSPMAPLDVKIGNPAFDVTPAGLIKGFITEDGIKAPPFKD